MEIVAVVYEWEKHFNGRIFLGVLRGDEHQFNNALWGRHVT